MTSSVTSRCAILLCNLAEAGADIADVLKLQCLFVVLKFGQLGQGDGGSEVEEGDPCLALKVGDSCVFLGLGIGHDFSR